MKPKTAILGKELTEEGKELLINMGIVAAGYFGSFFASLQTEARLYPNLFIIATIFSLFARGVYHMVVIWRKTDSWKEKAKQKLRDELKEEDLEEQKKFQGLLDEITEEEALLKSMRKDLEKQKRAFKMATWLISTDKRKE